MPIDTTLDRTDPRCGREFTLRGETLRVDGWCAHTQRFRLTDKATGAHDWCSASTLARYLPEPQATVLRIDGSARPAKAPAINVAHEREATARALAALACSAAGIRLWDCSESERAAIISRVKAEADQPVTPDIVAAVTARKQTAAEQSYREGVSGYLHAALGKPAKATAPKSEAEPTPAASDYHAGVARYVRSAIGKK